MNAVNNKPADGGYCAVSTMTRRKSDFMRTLVLVVFVCPFVFSRPQESLTTSISYAETTESPLRVTPVVEETQNAYSPSIGVPVAPLESTPREVKNKSPAIKDSIKKVADQLLETAVNNSLDTPLVPDTRIPPKIKTQVVQKNKIRTRNEDGDEINDYSHAGVAVPVSMEELELENRVSSSNTESSTSSEGLSTWILLNNPVNKENSTLATEPTKIEENKKSKPTKNKPKRPQNKPSMPKRPIIGSTNKSDLVASGSAINENVYNKIKDTVLTNVQKNKNSPSRAASTTTTTTRTTTTTTSTTEAQVKEIANKEQGSIIPVIKVPSKSNKKKEKLKHKPSTTLAPVSTQSALLPLEAKEQEIELEVSTPPSTTKKPKRSSTKKKTKTKKRKVSKPKPAQTSSSTELKTANKTKTTKTSKKPTKATGPFTSQIYNYFSREVMPSVGVGVIGLAGLVGIASYFLYPFATPVRRTFEVDKKDDIYKNNAEEYANEGNGQPEEEMLGTVLAGMPAHAKQKLNPYAAQTNYNARYPAKKEQQDIRYRHVTKYDPNYGVHYPQQKTGIAHGAVYSEPLNYHRRPQYETRHAYTTSYPAVEPIFAAPQTGPSDATSYGSESSGSVVYGVKPSADTDFKPVYPYDPQFYGETTTSPVTYSQTSMYLGSNNESEQSEDNKYNEDSNSDTESGENKFVVGNVPKELSDSDTPAVVPEHGPRKLNRKRRSLRLKRGVAIEEILEAANKKEKEVFLSNEIDEALRYVPHIPQSIELLPIKTEENYINIIPIEAVNPSNALKGENAKMGEIVESVSTIPIEDSNDKTTDMSNEILPSSSSQSETAKNSDITNTERNLQADTTTDIKLESTSTTSTVPKTTKQPTDFPEILTYPPPSSSNGFFGFLQRLVEFKYRLGLSILQNTSKSLNNYLRSMEESIQRAASDASH
ncbi:cell wall protein DAN4-like isoform X1 [Pieris napi]|uniref:cell wall protein DAN4-like isoform X1 n=2 Tax=Pieris napi TaxID=78633 RepID=UPI001FBA78F8|nr:cell wall protein DAN4-like isoform X1 [Pieris napi]